MKNNKSDEALQVKNKIHIIDSFEFDNEFEGSVSFCCDNKIYDDFNNFIIEFQFNKETNEYGIHLDLETKEGNNIEYNNGNFSKKRHNGLGMKDFKNINLIENIINLKLNQYGNTGINIKFDRVKYRQFIAKINRRIKVENISMVYNNLDSDIILNNDNITILNNDSLFFSHIRYYDDNARVETSGGVFEHTKDYNEFYGFGIIYNTLLDNEIQIPYSSRLYHSSKVTEKGNIYLNYFYNNNSHKVHDINEKIIKLEDLRDEVKINNLISEIYKSISKYKEIDFNNYKKEFQEIVNKQLNLFKGPDILDNSLSISLKDYEKSIKKINKNEVYNYNISYNAFRNIFSYNILDFTKIMDIFNLGILLNERFLGYGSIYASDDKIHKNLDELKGTNKDKIYLLFKIDDVLDLKHGTRKENGCFSSFNDLTLKPHNITKSFSINKFKKAVQKPLKNKAHILNDIDYAIGQGGIGNCSTIACLNNMLWHNKISKTDVIENKIDKLKNKEFFKKNYNLSKQKSNNKPGYYFYFEGDYSLKAIDYQDINTFEKNLGEGILSGYIETGMMKDVHGDYFGDNYNLYNIIFKNKQVKLDSEKFHHIFAYKYDEERKELIIVNHTDIVRIPVNDIIGAFTLLSIFSNNLGSAIFYNIKKGVNY